jgi:hypothetical protein
MWSIHFDIVVIIICTSKVGMNTTLGIFSSLYNHFRILRFQTFIVNFFYGWSCWSREFTYLSILNILLQSHPSVRIKGTENNYEPIVCEDSTCVMARVNAHFHCPCCAPTDTFQDPVILKAHFRVKHVDKGIEFAGEWGEAGMPILRVNNWWMDDLCCFRPSFRWLLNIEIMSYIDSRLHWAKELADEMRWI